MDHSDYQGELLLKLRNNVYETLSSIQYVLNIYPPLIVLFQPTLIIPLSECL